MKDKNDYGFKFKIGEIVYYAGSFVDTEKEGFVNKYYDDADKFFVVGRLFNEDGYGVNRNYDCRPLIGPNSSVGAKLIRFCEIELVRKRS